MYMSMYIREYVSLRDQLACHVWAELVFSMIIAFHHYVASTIRFVQLNEWGWVGKPKVGNPNGQPYLSTPLKRLVHN